MASTGGGRSIVQQMTSRFEPPGSVRSAAASEKNRTHSSPSWKKKTASVTPKKEKKEKKETVVVVSRTKPTQPKKETKQLIIPASPAAKPVVSSPTPANAPESTRRVMSQIQRIEIKATAEKKAAAPGEGIGETLVQLRSKEPDRLEVSKVASATRNAAASSPISTPPTPVKRSSVVSQLVNRFESREREVRQTKQIELRHLRKTPDISSLRNSGCDLVTGHKVLARARSDSTATPSPSTSRRSSADPAVHLPGEKLSSSLPPPPPSPEPAMPTVTETETEAVAETQEVAVKESEACLYEDITIGESIYETMPGEGLKSLVNGNSEMSSLDVGELRELKNRPLPSIPPEGDQSEEKGQKKSLFSRIKRRMAVKGSTKGNESRKSGKFGGGSPKRKGRHAYVELDVPQKDEEKDDLELKSEDEATEDLELKSEDEMLSQPEECIYEDAISAKSTGGGGDITIKVEDAGTSNDVYEDVVETDSDGKRLQSPSPPPSPGSSKPQLKNRSSWATFPSPEPEEGKLAASDGNRERSSSVPLDPDRLSGGGESLYETPTDLLDEVVLIGFADALWDYISNEPDELSFSAGDLIAVTEMADEEWWGGFIDDRQGWFPKNYVRMRISDTESVNESSNLSKKFSVRRKKKLSSKEVRSKVLEEILNTERDYVSHLTDIVKGYLARCRENSLFSPELLQLIFCNVEDLCTIHTGLVASLEESMTPENPYDSCIGHCFVEIEEKFQAYSEYCNNHPDAVAKLGELQMIQNYKFFFEACRLLQSMQEISLDGYLLTPVQKICKYPLQLSELLKSTPETHPDYEMVVAAKKVMSNVAVLINERKRRYDGLRRIAEWQMTIDEWEGEDVIVRSSDLIYSGELNKISKGRSQERKLFLFDNQLIYCKKELLGGGRLQYRGRLDLRNSEVVDLKDGEGHYGNTPVNNAWKMNNVKKNKWYILYTRTPEEKAQWVEAFKQEQARIEEDLETGFSVSKTKRQAIMTQFKKLKVATKRQKPLKPQLKKAATLSVVTGTVKLPEPISSADYGMGKMKKGRRHKRRKDFTT